MVLNTQYIQEPFCLYVMSFYHLETNKYRILASET